MSQDINHEEGSNHGVFFRNTLGFILTSIFLGVVGSGLWDILFRPGFGWLSQTLFEAFTFGSESLQDLSYESAALDPRPLPSLLLLLFSPAVFSGVFLGLVMRRMRRTREILTGEKNQPNLRRVQILGYFLLGFFTTLAFIGVFSVSVVNKSVAVWRIFHTNLEIVSPYITDAEKETLNSEFRSIKSKSDYEALSQQLVSIAKKNDIPLHGE